ncbi:S9 family peptidase [Ornithinimicrobium faecis]|uniref:S9 family peptidase n=1 Tax=Ornithinimicrobium faecis TaxID=2934158 RepID=A0ABY4YWY7_9MICO|nr:S9 family peptidase [Ornithinimicrobium sp. HY1793]USQ81271.1 S9 family peptidase [Ornithinimicrobium sp. HY1793]
MTADLRDSPEFAAVTEHLSRVHSPGFGRPHALSGLHATSDGERAVVTGLVHDELLGLPRSALFRATEGELREVSSVPGSSAHGARFSPDGSTLAFLSDRRTRGVSQLHLLLERLGEAIATAEVPGTVEYAEWSPDGRRVLLGVAGLGADLAGAQGSGTIGTTPRTAESWQPLVETGEGDDAWRSLWTHTIATGELTRISPEGTNCWEATWCGPDRVVTVASDDPSEDSWYAATLRVLSADGDTSDDGEQELLRSEVQLGLPTGSPDGKHVAVVQAVCSDRGIVAGDLTLINLGSGEQTLIKTAGTDVTCLQWIDAGRLGYVGQRRLNSVAGIIDIATGQTREVIDWSNSCGGQARYPSATFTTDGRVVAIEDSYELPPQVVLTDGQEHRVLGSVAHPGTDYLSSVAGTARPVTWSAPDGLEIDGVLCIPPGDGPFPLVVNVHGGPVWGFRNIWSMMHAWVPLLVSRGYAVLNPNPRGSGGRGQEFAGRVVGDMGGADTHDYLSGIDALVDQGLVDPDRVGLIGGSYGGFMSSWLVTQDQRFAAAVPISPVTNWYSQTLTSNIGGWGMSFLDGSLEQPGGQAHTRSPALQASAVRTPCLNVAGALDRCTPPGQAREFHQALRAHGVDSELVIYPEEGHGVRAHPALADFLTRTLDWFGRYMPAGHP